MTFINKKKTAIPFDADQHDIFPNDLALCTPTHKIARLKGSKDQVAWVTANPVQLPDGGSVPPAKIVRLKIYKANDRARYLKHIREAK